MIYDCCVLYNALDLLEIRLHELNEVVDKYVIVEATKTHTNVPKKLYFKEAKNNEIFSKFREKIIYIVVDDMPMHGVVKEAVVNQDKDNWVREQFLNNSILRGLVGCRDNDIIAFSHGDEIPRRRAVEDCARRIKEADFDDSTYALEQSHCRYWINCYLVSCGQPWYGTRVTTYKRLKELSPFYLRWQSPEKNQSLRIPNGGWHYSWLGPVDRVLDKLNTITEQHLNLPEYRNKEYLQKIINSGGDLLDQGMGSVEWKNPDIDKWFFPEYVLKNLEKFECLIKKNQPERNILYNRTIQEMFSFKISTTTKSYISFSSNKFFCNPLLMEILFSRQKNQENIPRGEITNIQGILLSYLSMILPKKNFLQIGCSNSVFYIAPFLDAESTLYIIDKEKENLFNTLQLLVNPLMKFDVKKESIVPLVENTNTKWDKKIDLLIISSEHSLDETKTNITRFAPFLNINGFILVYGYGSNLGITEYCNIIQRNAEEFGFRIFRQVNNFPDKNIVFEIPFYEKAINEISETTFLFCQKII